MVNQQIPCVQSWIAVVIRFGLKPQIDEFLIDLSLIAMET